MLQDRNDVNQEAAPPMLRMAKQRVGGGEEWLKVLPLIAVLWIAAGCAYEAPAISQRPAQALPHAHSSHYRVQRGETLWGIAHDFGWDPHSLARLNRLTDPTHLKSGQLLFIPPPPESDRFVWPTRGALFPAKGATNEAARRSLQIQAPEGSFVLASRTGRVAVAAQQLSGFGKTIVLDHGDGYVTVYTRLEQLLVNPGMTIRQGEPIGRVGKTPLYFEIRYGTAARNPLQLLP